MIKQLVDGVLWDIALWVFTIGVLWRIFSIFLVGSKKDFSVARKSGLVGAVSANISRFIPRAEMRSRTRIHVIAGYMFHLGLFALLFFAAPHILFVESLTGLSWKAMPYWAFIISAQFAFVGLLLLWIHRIMDPVTRLISSADDHAASILTFVVMFTGCLALLEGFEGLRILHKFTVELLMVYFPFSRLMHAFMFIPSRAFTGAWFGRRGVKS